MTKRIFFSYPSFLEILFLFSFKSGINRDKPHPRMMVSEEPYVEPTKLQRLSLRDANKKQWTTDKVRLNFFPPPDYFQLIFLFSRVFER